MRLMQLFAAMMLLALFLCVEATGQARAVYVTDFSTHCPDSDTIKSEVISITFKDRISFAQDASTPSAPRHLIYFEDSSDKVLQYWSKMCYTNDKGFGIVNLFDFRSGPFESDPLINLASSVKPGTKRNFLIVLKPVMLPGDGQGNRIQVTAKVPSPLQQPPLLTMLKPGPNGSSRDRILIQTFGIAPAEVVKWFASSPEKILISYDFAASDTVPSFTTTAESIETNPNSPFQVVVKPQVPLSRRPEGYTITVKFPTAVLKNAAVNHNFAIPVEDENLEASLDVTLKPDVPKRAESEFYFETAFTSIVNAKNRKRGNVGVFGLHLKPTISQLTMNVNGTGEGAPTWFALRPLFDADVDTQPISDSESPNRITFGIDGELGRNVGLNGGPKFLQYFIWTNGFRYDSDRDFKLQTAYWHTDFVPYFLNFEKTREQALRQYRYPGGEFDPDRSGRQPLISAYRFRPMVGYELGRIIKRDARQTDFPTDTISRLLAGFDAQLEFKRLVTFSLTNTYYFVGNLDRRKHRDYLETGLDINTGYLFRRDLGGIQNAISLSFKRGEQPPSFKPVNSFSVGFKIFR